MVSNFFSSLVLMTLARTYRDYVNDTGQDVAVEAGPNGPENVGIFSFPGLLHFRMGVKFRITTWILLTVRIWAYPGETLGDNSLVT